MISQQITTKGVAHTFSTLALISCRDSGREFKELLPPFLEQWCGYSTQALATANCCNKKSALRTWRGQTLHQYVHMT